MRRFLYILLIATSIAHQAVAQKFFVNFKDSTCVEYQDQSMHYSSTDGKWAVGQEYHDNFDIDKIASITCFSPLDADTCRLAVISSGTINSKEIIKPIFDEYPILEWLIGSQMKELSYFNVNYPTSDARGNHMIMSGKICMRTSDIVNKSIKGIILMNHYTITKNEECPSASDSAYEQLFANTGYAVVMADYLGFGTTQDYPQTYLHSKSTAMQCIDLLNISKKWLDTMGIKYGNEVLNIGYSQGGAVAMDIQRYAEACNIHITKTMAGGGPYDLLGTYDYVIANKTTSYPVEIPLFVVGMNYAYNLNFDYSKIFKEPLLSNYSDWLNSKKYTTKEICNLMGSNDLTDLVEQEFLDTTNIQSSTFRNTLRINSTTNGWVSKAQNPVILFHSTDDDIVPVLNAYEMKSKLEHDGYDETNLTTIIKSMGAHGKTGVYFDLYCYCLIQGITLPSTLF